MLIRVLGSAAGGGFPQWNCGCANCARARSTRAFELYRSQECVAVSSDGVDWFLLNASPEIRQQIEDFVPLHPRAPRHSPIAGIVLTNGDLDHTLGLLSLRESYPLAVYATDSVRRGFSEQNVLYRTLERFPGQLTWHRLVSGERTQLLRASGEPSGLSLVPVVVPGKPPVHLEATQAPHAEQAIGLSILEEATGKRVAYFSSFGALTPEIERASAEADCVFWDGTFWSRDELVSQGLGEKLAEDMAHAPIGGPDGTAVRLAPLRGRRLLIHINNTNPVLFPDSDEAKELARSGIEVASDGMEVTL